MINKIVSRDPKDLSNNLLLLKNRKKLCDATLIIDGERIPVHSNVLASCCEYFESQFVNSKSPMMIVEFLDFDKYAFLSVIEYCYTGTMEISENNAKEIAKIANFLILPLIIESCAEILENILNITNCLSTWKFAEREHFENLKSFAFSLIKNNFESISKSGEFLSLEFSELRELLRSSANQITAIVAYNAVKSWIDHDNDSRKNNLIDLLNLVELKCLPRNFLISESLELCNSDGICFRKLIAASESKREICFGDSTLAAVGGYSFERVKSIEIFDTENREWIESKGINVNRILFTASLIDDQIILIGGKSNDTCVNTVESFNLKTRKLQTLPSIKHKRYELSSVQFHGCIYAIGGKDGNIVPYVEKWDLESDSWQDVEPLKTARYRCGTAVIDDAIFVIGGDAATSTNSVEAYNSSTNTWIYRKFMNHKRQAPGVAVVGIHIYVAGGWHGKNVVNSAERYDTKSDNWTLIEPMETARGYFGAGNLMGKLVVVGGWNVSSMSAVEIYDTENNKWSAMEPLKNTRRKHSIIEIPLALAKYVLSNNTKIYEI